MDMPHHPLNTGPVQVKERHVMTQLDQLLGFSSTHGNAGNPSSSPRKSRKRRTGQLILDQLLALVLLDTWEQSKYTQCTERAKDSKIEDITSINDWH
jgi:hypothetical protein